MTGQFDAAMSSKVNELFLIDRPNIYPEKEFAGVLVGLPEVLQQVFVNFRRNLAATRNTASVPSLIAKIASGQSHLQRFVMAARIRAIDPQEILRKVQGSQIDEKDKTGRLPVVDVMDIAEKTMLDFLSTQEGRLAVVHDMDSMLLHLADDEDFLEVSRELLLQAMVGTWSALEVLVNDALEALVNLKPDLSRLLLDDPVAKRRFELPKLSVDELINSGFNLSTSMGTLLFSSRDFSDIQTIKAACFSLFPTGVQMREILNNPIIWNLNQTRHLIVHNRGIIDKTYISNTGALVAIGSQIKVSPECLDKKLENAVLLSKVLAEEIGNIVK